MSVTTESPATYTPLEVADQAKLSPTTVRRHIREGFLPARKVGKRGYRVTAEALAKYIGEAPAEPAQ